MLWIPGYPYVVKCNRSKYEVALDNSDIQVDEKLRAAQTQVDTVPIMVAQPHEIMYEVELGAD